MALVPVCDRCAAALDDSGTYTTSGLLVCRGCSARDAVTRANAQIVEGERQVQERKAVAAAGAMAAGGCGVLGIVAMALVALVVVVLLGIFARCVGALPPWFDVG